MVRNRTSSGDSALAALRSLVPERPCRFDEALRIGELQANRFLQVLGVDSAPVPDEVVSELPRIEVHRRALPMSGLSYWNGSTWVVALNRSEPLVRQRFTLLHEFKHIVDHGRVARLYTGNSNRTAEQQAEHAADYFAGCVLMPRTLLKRAWASGLQAPDQLARHFETSERAISVRLAQVGLLDESDRHGGGRVYHRSAEHVALWTREVAA